jgi:hypothetical protein
MTGKGGKSLTGEGVRLPPPVIYGLIFTALNYTALNYTALAPISDSGLT